MVKIGYHRNVATGQRSHGKVGIDFGKVEDASGRDIFMLEISRANEKDSIMKSNDVVKTEKALSRAIKHASMAFNDEIRKRYPDLNTKIEPYDIEYFATNLMKLQAIDKNSKSKMLNQDHRVKDKIIIGLKYSGPVSAPRPEGDILSSLSVDMPGYIIKRITGKHICPL